MQDFAISSILPKQINCTNGLRANCVNTIKGVSRTMGTPGRKESPRVQVIYEYSGSMERKIGLGTSGIYKRHNINAQRVMR